MLAKSLFRVSKSGAWRCVWRASDRYRLACPGTLYVPRHRLTCEEVCQVIAEESLAVLKDPVESPGMQQKLVQKHAFVVHNQEIKAVPTKVYQTPRTTTPTTPALPVCDTRVSYAHQQEAPSRWCTPATAATVGASGHNMRRGEK
jgi:hypothetical protein